MSPVGRTTSRAQRAVSLISGSSFSDASVSCASDFVVGARSSASPRNSSWESSLRISRTHGNDASIVAALSLTPGRISRANARVGGNARLSEASVALAFSSVPGSRPIEVLRLSCSLAKAPIVVLKFVIRSLSRPSLRISAPVVLAVPASRRATSRDGSVPSRPSLTCDAPRSAVGPYL